jgi:hypothetical protein
VALWGDGPAERGETDWGSAGGQQPGSRFGISNSLVLSDQMSQPFFHYLQESALNWYDNQEVSVLLVKKCSLYTPDFSPIAYFSGGRHLYPKIPVPTA